MKFHENWFRVKYLSMYIVFVHMYLLKRKRDI